MKKNFFIQISLILILLLYPTGGNAYSSDPKEFISEIVIDTKKILNSNESKEIKSQKLSNLALSIVDIEGIAFYTLGKYRKSLNAEQKSEYLLLFEKYFLKSFTSRLTDHSNPKIDVLDVEVINEKYTIVNSVLLASSERPEIKINWRVYTKDPDKPIIRDLSIEGLSLARTQKEEFASIIETNNGEISGLFDKLKEFINK